MEQVDYRQDQTLRSLLSSSLAAWLLARLTDCRSVKMAAVMFSIGFIAAFWCANKAKNSTTGKIKSNLLESRRWNKWTLISNEQELGLLWTKRSDEN